MTLVVLAAGMGSRYGGIKQLDPITENSEFIIDFSVYDAIKAGFDKVVFIIKKDMLEDFESTIGRRISPFIKVEYAFQEIDRFVGAENVPKGRIKPWGTAHAVLCASDKVTENFVVINADDFYGREAFEKMAELLKNLKDSEDDLHACMVSYVLGNTLTENGTVSRGVCSVDENGMLIDVVETTKISPDGDTAAYFVDDVKYPIAYETPVSMNFWGFTPNIFGHFKKSFERFLENINENPLKCECYLPMVVGEAMKGGFCDVKTYITNAKWFGVTYLEDKADVVNSVRKLIEDGVYPNGLWK